MRFVVLLVAAVLVVASCARQPESRPAPPTTPTATPSTTLIDIAASPSPSGEAAPTATPTAGPATPVAEAPPSPAAPPAPSPAGQALETALTAEITEEGEAKGTATEFPDTVKRIYAVVAPLKAERGEMFATWVAVDVEGYEPGTKVANSRLTMGQTKHWYGDIRTKRWVPWFEAPLGTKGGFVPGLYRVDISTECADPCVAGEWSLPFKVVPGMAPSVTDETQIPRGFNIAAAALGGELVSFTSQSNDESRAASNVIDGLPMIIGDYQDCEPSCGWWSREQHPVPDPQELIFSFYKEREAVVSAVLLDTSGYSGYQSNEALPRHVEVWVSTTSPRDGFTKVAEARFAPRQGKQAVVFAPTQARFVKVRFLSNYGGRHVWVGELQIIEADPSKSILVDVPKNIAAAALGGALVRFSSLRGHHRAGSLIDGRTNDREWTAYDDYLPQEIIFAFRGDQRALVDRIVLDPRQQKNAEGADPRTWPKLVSVAVTTETPFEGWEEVGQFTLRQEAAPQAFPIKRRARFVRLRILKTFGGTGYRASLGEVQIIEGSETGYQSILLTSEETALATGPSAAPVEAGVADERESNNTPAEANPLALGRRTKGIIDPLGEHDFFKLTVPGTSPSVLTLELLSRPFIRTSMSLLDPAGKTLKDFDPRQAPGQRAEFSWLVRPGEYLARLTEPIASLVLIWDTSGSMREEGVKSLKQAVEAHVEQVQPTERVNLVRFSGHASQKEPVAVEVLLPKFTSDRQQLKGVLADKFFAKGGTPFYDAVMKGFDLLAPLGGNRAVIVMTDGVDTTSTEILKFGPLAPPAFWRLLEERRIRLYTIGLGEDMPLYDPSIGTSGRRALRHASIATNARSFFTRDPEQLKAIYQQIADELRRPTPYYLKASVSPGLGTLSVTATGERLEAVAAPSQIELILDVSGSMKRQIEGRQRMDIAKDVMVQVIQGLPDDARVALRFYGHRIREGRPGDCQDTELVFPFGRINKAAMINRVRAVKALGTTPIAYTLRQVAKDFGSAPGEKLVILVTDGKEECGGSPSAVVSEMVAKGIKVRLNIVGFALAEAAVKQEMERVAKITGGKFYDAQNAKALRQAIQQSLAIPYEVRDAAGVRVAGGLTGEAPVQVPEGIYTVTVRAAGQPIVVPKVRVRYQAFTKVALRKEGQQIGVQVIGP